MKRDLKSEEKRLKWMKRELQKHFQEDTCYILQETLTRAKDKLYY
tara:strand:- start:411 stop:545 length:135 start_codon:yes stop_codon:yes gene_type:complete